MERAEQFERVDAELEEEVAGELARVVAYLAQYKAIEWDLSPIEGWAVLRREEFQWRPDPPETDN